MKSSSVLLLSNDSVIGALLLSLLELEGFSPLHPEPNEAPATAVARLKPQLVLIDVYHPAARSDALYEAAAAANTTPILFSSDPWHDGLKVLARQRGIQYFTLPIAPAGLMALLTAALGE